MNSPAEAHLALDNLSQYTGDSGFFRDPDYLLVRAALDERVALAAEIAQLRAWKAQVTPLLMNLAYEDMADDLCERRLFIGGHQEWCDAGKALALLSESSQRRETP